MLAVAFFTRTIFWLWAPAQKHGWGTQNSLTVQVRAVHQIARFSSSPDFIAWFLLHMPCSVHTLRHVTQKKKKAARCIKVGGRQAHVLLLG